MTGPSTITDDQIDRFLTDAREHIVPARYDGAEPNACLIGQLHLWLAHEMDRSMMLPRVTNVASDYGFPIWLVDVIYQLAADVPLQHNLDAALDMAAWVMRRYQKNGDELTYGIKRAYRLAHADIYIATGQTYLVSTTPGPD